MFTKHLCRRRLWLFGATVAAIIVTSACGGSESSPTAPLWADARARPVSTSDAAVTNEASQQVFVVKKYNVTTDDRDIEATLLKRSIALLDALGIGFQLLECGMYVSDFSGGYVGYSPSWNKFAIAKSDLQRAKSVGFEDFDPNTPYRFEYPFVCGSLSEATSASSRIIQLAALLYPDLFPGYPVDGNFDGYSYASFANGNYVGIKDGRVYVHNGKNWNYLDVGSIADFISAY